MLTTNFISGSWRLAGINETSLRHINLGKLFHVKERSIN